MQISSRIKLHLSPDAKKEDFITLTAFENAIVMDNKIIGETVEEAIDTLDTLTRELLKMQAGYAAALKHEGRTPTCSCAAINAQGGLTGEIAACSRCAGLPHAVSVNSGVEKARAACTQGIDSAGSASLGSR